MALIPSKSNSTRKNLLKDQSGHYVFGIDFPNYVKISVSMNEYKVNLEEFKVNNKLIVIVITFGVFLIVFYLKWRAQVI